MKVAVEGCAHGELDTIYEAVDQLEKKSKVKIDLLIICGDFQAVRNPVDLSCMAVPPKYQKLNTFYKYYSGEKVAPVLTIFIGGNHEASNYLSELAYGGWVATNIYYLGYANVIKIAGVRIAGLSGIYKGHDYLKGHFECPPYDQSSKKSVYHIRNTDVFRLKQIKNPIDICISHDWPRGVYNYGNKSEILRWKPFFKDEMDNNKLGSQPAEELLHKLKPSYWFSAHLHCKFAALIPHDDKKNEFTKFLALDKCLPRRKFLQVLEIGEKMTSSHCIEYDPEWLCILRSTNHLLNTSRSTTYMPGIGGSEKWNFAATEEELKIVHQLFDNNFTVPNNFTLTAPPYKYGDLNARKITLKSYINSQTTELCKLLEITDPFLSVLNSSNNKSQSISDVSYGTDETNCTSSSINPDEISCSDDEDDVLTKDEVTDTDGSSSGVYFIDKKGTNQSSLITPNMKKFLLSQYCSTPVSECKSATLEMDFPELKHENQATVQEKTESAPDDDLPVKKFKRRNLSLYQSENETD